MESIKAKRTLVYALVVLLLNTAMPLAAGGRSSKPARSSVIRMAPAAPVFDQKTLLAELAERRARVGQAVGPKGIAVLFSTEPRVYTNDVSYEYRQENNLYYLTNLKQKGATLVLSPGNELLPEILFLPRRNPTMETWTGHMYSVAEASQVSGIKEIWDASEFAPFMEALRHQQAYRPKAEKILRSSNSGANETSAPSGFEKVFGDAGKNEAELYLLISKGDSLEYRQEQLFASAWAKSALGYSIKDLSPIFASVEVAKVAAGNRANAARDRYHNRGSRALLGSSGRGEVGV